MSRTYLRLRFRNDGDGTGKLLARAEADGFAGEGSAYFNTSAIEEFAEAIGAFPLPSQDPRLSIASGFSRLERHDGVEDEHLAITVYLADAQRGYIGIQIRMATEAWQNTRAQSQKTARIEVLTTYEPLSKFSKDLLALLHDKTDEALLEGEITI